ncbi:MAG: class I SAM-dependent methyltransferase [Lachnospiraceae bacterium]|nr:class I SAM-dependent methyltransferase [Lachnospiraceae bacterium]
MEQRDYWNSVSEKKEFTTPFHAEAFSKYVKKDALIVDVGCGYGRTLNELTGLGYSNLIGLDFSQGMIDRGKKAFPSLDLRIKTDDSIDLPESSVDAVILFAVLTCIVDNEDQKKLVSEIYRVLKPGGILYVNDFILNIDERNLNRYKQYEEKYGCYGVFELPEGAVVRHHSEDWIKSLLNDFDQKECERLICIMLSKILPRTSFVNGVLSMGQQSIGLFFVFLTLYFTSKEKVMH